MKMDVRNSALWKLWGKTLAAKWSGDQSLIDQVESDPDRYVKEALKNEGIVVDTRVRVALNIPGKKVSVGTESIVYVLPWPGRDQANGIITTAKVMLSDTKGPPDPHSTDPATKPSSGGGGHSSDCCCCCSICCSC